MQGLTQALVAYPVQGEQTVLYDDGYFGSTGSPTTVYVWQSEVSADGLERTLKFRVATSSPEFRKKAKNYAKAYNKAKGVPDQRRAWRAILKPEADALKELIQLHGRRWKTIQEQMVQRGFPERRDTTYLKYARTNGFVTDKADSCSDPSSGELQDAAAGSAMSSPLTDTMNKGS